MSRGVGVGAKAAPRLAREIGIAAQVGIFLDGVDSCSFLGRPGFFLVEGAVASGIVCELGTGEAGLGIFVDGVDVSSFLGRPGFRFI